MTTQFKPLSIKPISIDVKDGDLLKYRAIYTLHRNGKQWKKVLNLKCKVQILKPT